MGNPVVLLHADILIDRSKLSAEMRAGWAEILAERIGGDVDGWTHAYQSVADDWESYWADLDLSSDDSVEQWREGRWRVIRAWFRLAGFEPPSNDQIATYLDTLTGKVGERCNAWRDEAVNLLHALVSAGYEIIIVDPYAPGPLVYGMLRVCCADTISRVIGPDDLEEVGLDGITWQELALVAQADPACIHFVSPITVRGGHIIPPPSDLTALIPLLAQGVPSDAC